MTTKRIEIWVDPGETITCPNCGGTGNDPETMICVMCGGEGVLRGDDEDDDGNDDNDFDPDACPDCGRTSGSWDGGFFFCDHCGYIGR